MNKQNSDPYAGDSEEKSVARGAFWSIAPEPTPERPALVLASRDGGDIEVLRRLGAKKGSIIAIDKSKDAIDSCMEKFGDYAAYKVSDVKSFADGYRGKFSTSLLDFCRSVDAAMVKDIMSVARKTEKVFGIVVQLGREQRSDDTARLCSVDKYIERMLGEFFPGFKKLDRNKKAACRSRVKSGVIKNINSGVNPFGIKGTYCGVNVVNDYLEINPTAAIREHESDPVFDNEKQGPLSARRNIIADVIDIALGTSEGRISSNVLSLQYVGHRSPMAMIQMDLVDSSGELDTRPSNWVKIKKGKSYEAIRGLCLDFPDSGLSVERLSLACGISKGTVAAWKAHKTMGTYDKVA